MKILAEFGIIKVIERIGEMKMNERLQRKGKASLDNLGTWCMSEDKRQMMQFLNCDEKYNNERASDFELFAEWERILPLCIGTGSAELYFEQLALLGIEERTLGENCPSAGELWQKGNAVLCEKRESIIKIEYQKYLENQGFNVSDFIMNFTKETSETIQELSDAATRICEELPENGKILFCADGTRYARPDRYHASLLWQRLCRDEKLNGEDFFALAFQLLIEVLLLRKQRGEKTSVLLLTDDSDLRMRTVKYLGEHRLLLGELRFAVSLTESVREWSSLCRCNGEFLARPALLLSPSDFGASFDAKMNGLLSALPIGALCFAGIASDSFSLSLAARSLLEKKLDGFLCRASVCDEIRQKIINDIFNS